jgi:transcriptional regulator with XRE-family HTH domain
MSTGRTQTFAEQVAAEIRAEMGRQQVSNAALAELLGVSEMWVSRKKRGLTPLTLDEVQRIAEVLDVEVAELLPSADQTAERVLTRRRRLPASYPIAAGQATPDQPNGHHIRPTGRAAGSPRSMSRVPAQPAAGISRPARLSHPPAPAPHGATTR